VYADGRVAASEVVGAADLSEPLPARPTTRYRIGSVSKLLTATAALRLAADRRLNLDAPLRTVLAGVPADKAEITIRQLAGHLSGLPHYTATNYVNTTRYRNVSDTVAGYLSLPLLTAPGTKYAYSSYGYNVLGAVIQQSAAKEFRQVVSDQVLTPLNMAHTAAEVDPQGTDAARLYARGDGDALVAASPSDLSDRWPSGGYVSTAEDLVRFGVGVMSGSFLPTELRRVLTEPQRIDGKPTKVGFGWRIAIDPDGRQYIHHGGDSVGGRAFLLVYPSDGVAVALLTNVSFAAIGEREAQAVAKAFLK
jgi:CubicO group peptidase (beta-lactamase class C family)